MCIKVSFPKYTPKCPKGDLLTSMNSQRPPWAGPELAEGGVGGKKASGIASSSESQIPEVFLFKAEIDFCIPSFKL